MTIATTPAIRPTLPIDQIENVKRWVDHYRSLGYQPLPSRLDDKRPFATYAEHWETRIEGDLFARHGYNCNCQIMTGAFWKLLVIDLDGPEAPAAWAEMEAGHGRAPRTWEVSSDGVVKHLWFSLPDGCPPVRSGRLWSVWDAEANEGKGDWRKHLAVERLADRKLVVAPPSLHPKTGVMYHWVKGRSPYEMARPAMAPRWLADMPVMDRPRIAPVVAARPLPARRRSPSSAWATAAEILAAIPDKIGLAETWGMKVANRNPNAAGWVSVHRAAAEDRTPSASFSPESGRYWEEDLGRAGCSFFDLAAMLGAYRDSRDARDHLASVYLTREIAS